MPRLSHLKATRWAFILFLISLGCVAFTETWWPGVLLILGLPLTLRQFLVGRYRAAIISAITFIGGFVTVTYDVNWELFLPTIFVIGALYMFFNEFTLYAKETEEEIEEDFLADRESEFQPDQKKRVRRQRVAAKKRSRNK